MSVDPADLIAIALDDVYLPAEFPGATAVLHVEADWRATDATPRVLVADDGGGLLRSKVFGEPVMRVCAIATGRTQARAIAEGCSAWLRANKPAGIGRITNVSTVQDGRDRNTGNVLAFFTMPVVVRS